MITEIKKPRILFINAGATVTGVPIIFINMIRWFKANTGFDITILTAYGGPLENEFRRLAPTFRWDGENTPLKIEEFYLGRVLLRITKKVFRIKRVSYQKKLLSKLVSKNFDLIYVNSVASIPVFAEIRKYIKAKTVLHVHELQMSILQFCGLEILKEYAPVFDHIIGISNAVANNLKEQFDIPAKKMSVIYTFIDINESLKINQEECRKAFRDMIGLPLDAFVVVSSGTTDWRKGADLVGQIAKKVSDRTSFPIYFVWIGGDNTGLEFQKLYYDLVKLNLMDKIHFLGIKENPLEYFAMADVFMLCSREEPLGIVALEAASLGKPILCFDQAGGMPEFVEEDCGFILPYMDLDTMADHIILLQNDKGLLQELGANAALKVQRHDIKIACRQIESIICSLIEA